MQSLVTQEWFWYITLTAIISALMVVLEYQRICPTDEEKANGGTGYITCQKKRGDSYCRYMDIVFQSVHLSLYVALLACALSLVVDTEDRTEYLVQAIHMVLFWAILVSSFLVTTYDKHWIVRLLGVLPALVGCGLQIDILLDTPSGADVAEEYHREVEADYFLIGTSIYYFVFSMLQWYTGHYRGTNGCMRYICRTYKKGRQMTETNRNCTTRTTIKYAALFALVCVIVVRKVWTLHDIPDKNSLTWGLFIWSLFRAHSTVFAEKLGDYNPISETPTAEFMPPEDETDTKNPRQSLDIHRDTDSAVHIHHNSMLCGDCWACLCNAGCDCID